MNDKPVKPRTNPYTQCVKPSPPPPLELITIDTTARYVTK